ncbi:MAG: hypothetical protein ACYCOU_02060, partial [Sulfobacillus sp.]
WGVACGREGRSPLGRVSKGPALRAGTGPLRWVAKDAHVPAAAREETSSPQKNACRIPGLRFTQRTGDMV